MKKLILATGTAFALVACGGGDEGVTVNETVDPVDAMLPGAFEITTEVTQLRSTDGTTPATPSEEGATQVTSVCVGEDGLLPAAAFAEPGDDCTIENPYARRGRLRQDLVCQRSGAGEVRSSISAEFDGETIDGQIRGASAFAGDGDYEITRTITGRRTGDCTEAEASEDLDGDMTPVEVDVDVAN